jgi:uncharacterized membrane protein
LPEIGYFCRVANRPFFLSNILVILLVLPSAAKWASVFLLSTVKFLGGPLAGSSMGLGFWQTMGLTVAGMMTSVFVFSGIGRAWVRHKQRQRRLRRAPIFSKRSRNIIKVFKKFGMGGIAFLTPILLSPIGGTVIATLLGVPRQRILLHMLWSALLWGGVLTLASAQIGRLLHHH